LRPERQDECDDGGEAACSARSLTLIVQPELPLYQKVYRDLRARIAAGDLAIGARLPPESELARQVDVSRITLRHALKLLAEEGLIARVHGRGTFVSGRARPVIASLHAIAPVKAAANIGASTEIEVIECRMVAASAQVAHHLALRRGERVQKVVRVRAHAGAPVALITTYVPEDIGRRIPRAALARATVLEHIQAAGVEPAHAEHAISALPADAMAARRLAVARGAALLAERRVVFTATWRPVELLLSACRPDRYEFRVSLTLTGGDDGDGTARRLVQNESLLRALAR
jgi:GntR family transcriptional regulator